MKLHKQCKIELVASKDETRSSILNPYLDIEPGKDGAPAIGRIVATNGIAIAVVPVKLEDGDVAGFVSADALAAERKAGHGIVCNGTLSVIAGPTFKRPEEAEFSKFPNWRLVIPDASRPVGMKLAFDVKMLYELCKAMGCTSVTLTVENEMSPIIVRPSQGKRHDAAELGAYGVIMPLKTV